MSSALDRVPFPCAPCARRHLGGALLTLLLLVGGTQVAAHPLAPALLELVEVGEGRVADVEIMVDDAPAVAAGANIDGHHPVDLRMGGQFVDDLSADEPGSSCDQDACARHVDCGTGTGLRDHQVETVRPEIRCQTPHQAATMAMPPKPLKNEKMRMSPSAEFWMPTSMPMALAS